jgi:2-polyprenyl-3-methyl-5-hydroxy-6-metoxy-1,4-benzoquinol methylase
MDNQAKYTQSQKISDEKYLQGREIERSSKSHTIEQVPLITPPTPTHEHKPFILDVGCGTGLNAKILTERGYSVKGVDISNVAIEKFIENGFEGKQCDIVIDGLPYSDNYFDIVFASEVIEHIADTEEFMREIKRVLKPKGTIILSTPNSSFWVYRVFSIIGKTLSEVQHPGHIRFFSKCLLIERFYEAGFSEIKMKSRKMYIVLPDKIGSILKVIGFGMFLTREFRFKTKEFIWYIGKCSENASSLFSDTLIVIAVK